MSGNRALLAAAIASSVLPALSCGVPGPESVLVFRDVRVFDGERTLERASVGIVDGVIVDVRSDLAIPPGSAVVEGENLTLLPGLIDAHVHFGGSSSNLEQALIFGVTTSLDMFADPERSGGPERRADCDGCGGPV